VIATEDTLAEHSLATGQAGGDPTMAGDLGQGVSHENVSQAK
jgi:hypothetical protein